MRKIVLLASAAFLTFAAPGLAGQYKDGVFVGEVSAQIQRAVNAYQRNHDVAALKAAITALVKGDPDLAADAVDLSQTSPVVLHAPLSTAPGKNCATVAQIAIAEGLGAAWGETAATNPQKAALIKSAVGHGSECLQTAYNTETAALAGEASANNQGQGQGPGGLGQGPGGGGLPSFTPPSSGGTPSAADGT